MTLTILKASLNTWRLQMKQVFKSLKPGNKTRKYATGGIFLVFFLCIFITTLTYIPFMGWMPGLLIILILSILSFLSAFLGVAAIRLIGKQPFWTLVAIMSGLPVIMLHFHVNIKSTFLIYGFLVFFSALLAGSVYWVWKKWMKSQRVKRIGALLCLAVAIIGFFSGIWWLLDSGSSVKAPLNAAMNAQKLPELLDVENPAQKGSHEIAYLTYGSGLDKHRPEYGAEVVLQTDAVDGSSFVEDWTGVAGKFRTRYFGFEANALPLNARVWYPQGAGPFPLVLMVHGNHLAQDFSDPGYAYLGQLLASRGFVAASVDQNFLNGSFTNFFKGMNNENDARAWVLLKHLELWRQWNQTPDHPFFHKIDMEHIALIGHSRGGEAVAHAALFNQLPFYPDNAKEIFNFYFNIKAVIAIAPSDGQYQPAKARTPLHNVNYLVIQGSHDADVSSYQGMRQFHRITYDDDFQGFSAGLYVYNANHGQFNSVWGNKDLASPRINFFNLKQLLSEEDQQQIAQVYISGFLEAHLKGKQQYQPLFMDYRKARHWLPENIYLNQYLQSQTQWICTFQEDLDLSTTSIAEGRIDTENLSIWREQSLFLNWGDYDSRVVVLGWNTQATDTLVPAYHIHVRSGSLKTSAEMVLVFSITETGEKALPHPENLDSTTTAGNSNNFLPNNTNRNSQTSDNGTGNDPMPIDFTIELEDQNGQSLRILLSDCKPLQPLLQRQLTKIAFMQNAGRNESILEHFYFPLNEWVVASPGFDLSQIVRISFLFNQSSQGVIAINNIGII